MGIANEQAAKVADRFKPKPEHEAPKTRIAALEEQVRALKKSAGQGGGQKPPSCRTCTRRQTHGDVEGKCGALTATCHACQKVSHYKACSKSGKGKPVVRAVGNDSDVESTNRI